MKESFVLYYEYEEYFKVLSEHDQAQLIMAIFAYERRSELVELDGMAQAFFMVIKNSLDRNRDKYVEMCEKRSSAGKQGGRPALSESKQKHDKAKKANALAESKSNQNKASKADNVPVPVPDNVPEQDSTPDGVQAADTPEAAEPETTTSKPKLRVPANDYEKIEDRYRMNFHALYLRGRVTTDTPVMNYGAIRKLEHAALTLVAVDNILAAIDNAMADDWIVSNGYSIQTILSGNQLNKLLNAKANQQRPVPGGKTHWDQGTATAPKRRIGGDE